MKNSSDAEKCPFLQLKEPGRRRESSNRGAAAPGQRPGDTRSPSPQNHRLPELRGCPGPAASPSSDRGMKERWRGERWRATGRERERDEAAGKLRFTHLGAFWMRLRLLGAAGASRSPGRAAGRAGRAQPRSRRPSPRVRPRLGPAAARGEKLPGIGVGMGGGTGSSPSPHSRPRAGAVRTPKLGARGGNPQRHPRAARRAL